MITAFVDENAMNALVGLETESDFEAKQNVTIEFIDVATLTAEVLFKSPDAEITIYVRDEMHTNGTVAFQSTANNGELSSDELTVVVAYEVAVGINQVLKEKGMLEECSNLDENTQGILFGLDENDELTVKIVEGKKRPELLCTTLFGSPQMMRPYADEIAKQSVLDLMSFEQLEVAAETGDSDAMERLAMIYTNGDDEIKANPRKAYYWFVKCAENGNDKAMFNVGLFTAKGFGTDRDFEKAAEWMHKASEAGDKDAEMCEKEYKKLVDAEKKAEAGDAQAQADMSIGLMKLGGSLEEAGKDKDYKESVMWAEKAVAQGNADGYWSLALAYHHGRGIKKDIDKAIELYQKGAEAGSDSCKHNLACEYMTGENIKKNQKKGFQLIKEAAENGYGLAMRDLGRCYQFANGTPGNMKKAVEWYEKALEVIDDPELAQKTAIFKTLADTDPDFDKDYPDEYDEDDEYDEYEDEEDDDDEDELDLDNVPEDFYEALESIMDDIEADVDEDDDGDKC
jgi:TPR repeat protein